MIKKLVLIVMLALPCLSAAELAGSSSSSNNFNNSLYTQGYNLGLQEGERRCDQRIAEMREPIRFLRCDCERTWNSTTGRYRAHEGQVVVIFQQGARQEKQILRSSVRLTGSRSCAELAAECQNNGGRL